MGDGNGAGTVERPRSIGYLSAAAFLLLLAVLALMPNQRSVVNREGIPPITPSDALIGLVFLVWLVDVVRLRCLRELHPPPWALAAYAAWAVVITLVVAFRKEPAGGCMKESVQITAYFVVAAALVANILDSPERLRTAGYVILGSGTVVAAIALAQGLRGPLVSGGSLDRIQSVRALFENNNVLSCYLAMLAPLCVGILLFWPAKPVKVWAGALAVLCLALTMNGGILVALVVSVLAVAAMRGRKHLACAACAVLVLAVFALPLLPRERSRYLSQSVSLFTKWRDPNNPVIVSYRYRRTQAGVNVFRAHPLTGVGPGTFQDHVGKQEYHLLDDGVTPTPTPPEDLTEANKFVDNRYVLTAAEMGVPGLLVLVSALILALRGALSGMAAAEDPRVKGLLAGCFGMVLAAMIAGIFTDFLVRGLALPLVFAMSVACRRGAMRGPRTSPPSSES